MLRTEILCPECFKKKLLRENENKPDAYCDECGTKFIIIGPRTVKYK
jgi:DNA-directed RNA polymerase subunit RPC12/RpoP